MSCTDHESFVIKKNNFDLKIAQFESFHIDKRDHKTMVSSEKLQWDFLYKEKFLPPTQDQYLLKVDKNIIYLYDARLQQFMDLTLEELIIIAVLFINKDDSENINAILAHESVKLTLNNSSIKFYIYKYFGLNQDQGSCSYR